LPVEDVRNMVGTLAAGVAPEAGKAVGKELKMVGNAIKEKLPSVRVELQKQLENKQIPTEKVGSVGAASVENNPYANQITGEENVRGQFPQVKLSKISEDVSKNEQIIRSKIANEILGDAGHVRSGVITGNENQLRNEHTQANMPNPTLEGQLYKQQIANEQNALSNYAQERVNATGASPTLINDEQRGMRINDAFHSQSGKGETPTSIIDYLNKAKDVVYKDAYNKVGNNVIQTTNIDNLLKNEQFKAGLEFKGNQGVASGASQLLKLAKEVGIEDEAGVVHPAGSVAAYDAVRKAMNSEWTPQNASAIRKINTAIDKDIAAVADPSLYKLGDRIHEAEKTIFESKGIKSLFGETDKNGVITSSTPLEKIPTKLNNLPKDQWRHIRDTLEDLSNGKIRGAPEGMPPIPEELKKQALAAKNEIDGALAREVYKAGANKAGVWNQNSANNVLNSIIGEKIVETFPPEEIKKFHTLNYGGHIMPGIHNYEGSGLQNRRVGLIEGNIEKAATGVGAATGGVVAGPVGAAVGGYLGGKAGSIAKESIAIKELTKAAEKAKNEMKKNAQLGKNKLNDIGKP